MVPIVAFVALGRAWVYPLVGLGGLGVREGEWCAEKASVIQAMVRSLPDHCLPSLEILQKTETV